jgi:ABC-2 type transport system permease protein
VRAVREIVKREFDFIRTDRRLALTVLVAPILYALLMGAVYINHGANELPVAVAAFDQSAHARQLIRMLEASPKLKITYRAGSEQEIAALIHQGKIDGAVVIPRDFSLRLKRGEDAYIGTFVNASTLIPANTVSSALNNVIQFFSLGVEIAKLQKSGLGHEAAVKAAMPVKLSLRPMFNPSFNYSNFMVPGLFITILQQIILMGMALSFSGERESGTLNRLFGISRQPWEIILGKSIPYLLVGLILAEFYLRVLFPLNDIPITGAWWLTFGFTALFIMTIVSWGLWVSSLCRSRLFATQILMFVAMPSFVLSGFTWPLSAMPEPVRLIGQMLPMTHFISSFRSVYLAGATLQDIYPSVLALILFLGVNLGLAFLGVKRLLTVSQA